MLYAFYSYKGGVGRSMALANLGELFHEQGLRTLLVDWDLEAPGLEAYFFRDTELAASRARRGLIDMLKAYKERLHRFVTSAPPPLPEEARKYDERLQQLLSGGTDVPQFASAASSHPTIIEKLRADPPTANPSPRRDLPEVIAASPFEQYLQCIHPPDSRENGLYLLSAGRRSDAEFGKYATTVQEFNWAQFYAAYDGRNYFEWFRSNLLEIADVVLIDTRTGVTEMGGVCTRQIPDAVIAFCAPNFQNVDGVARVISGINQDDVKRARDDRDVQIMAVPARIDDSGSDRPGRFAELFAEKLEQDAIVPSQLRGLDQPLWQLQIPYAPRYNHREELVIGPSATFARPGHREAGCGLLAHRRASGGAGR